MVNGQRPGSPQQQEISLQLPKSAFFLPELWPVAVVVVVALVVLWCGGGVLVVVVVVVVGDKKHLLLQLSS